MRVWPSPDVLAIFRFHGANEIDFDVDLRELQGQERLDVFCSFLTAIGRCLGEAVLMDSEGGDGSHPVLGFDVEAGGPCRCESGAAGQVTSAVRGS